MQIFHISATPPNKYEYISYIIFNIHIMNTLGERTKHVLKLKGIKVTELADFMGKSQAAVSSYIINRAYPSGEFFIALKRLMPDINLNWLITGEDEMFLVRDSNPNEMVEIKRKMDEMEARDKEMTTALMSMSRLIGKGESAKFKTVCDQPGVSIEKVNGRWSFASKHTHEHTVRFAV